MLFSDRKLYLCRTQTFVTAEKNPWQGTKSNTADFMPLGCINKYFTIINRSYCYRLLYACLKSPSGHWVESVDNEMLV